MSGIEKTIDFVYGDNQSEVFRVLDPSRSLIKTAGYSDELQQYVDSLKAVPGKTYALVNALSAGEYFGPNRNHDYFPEKALEQYHKTFEALGHIYKHHVNKDPNKALGKVSFSHYNPIMKRVELILELIDSKARDIVQQLEKGELPAVSMGTRVPFDICSICGNKAKTRAEYCHHLTKMPGHVYPNGQKVYAINTMPKFFDISIVTIPADRTASFVKRLLSSVGSPRVIQLDDFRNKTADSFQKAAEFAGVADINKKIDVVVSAIGKDPKRLIVESQKRLSKDQIEKLSTYPMSSVLSTMLGLRIAPLREDFQKLALYMTGHNKLADKLESEGTVFEVTESDDLSIPQDIDLNNFDTKIAEILIDDIEDMALTKQLVVRRGLRYIEKAGEVAQDTVYKPSPKKERSMISKVLFSQTEEPAMTAHKNPIAPLGVLGGLYYGYAKVFNNPSASTFRTFLGKYPWLLPVIVGAGTATSLLTQNAVFNKTAGWVDRFIGTSLVALPASYFAAGVQEDKALKGQPITRWGNVVRKHPLLVGLSSAAATATLFKKRKPVVVKTAELISKMGQQELDSIYSDLVY